SGAIVDAPGETWENINNALVNGFRGLAGGLTLAQLLQAERGVRNVKALPDLTEEQILAWADVYHRQNGSWPTKNSGPIDDTPAEAGIGFQFPFLGVGRGLPGGCSLARLIKQGRGNSSAALHRN